MSVTCPRCRVRYPKRDMRVRWHPLPVDVVVQCTFRDFTGAAQVLDQYGRPDYKPQMLVAIYAHTDRSKVWHEAYHNDGRDNVTTHPCGQRFVVAAVHAGRRSTARGGAGE